MATTNKLTAQFVSATKQFDRKLVHHPWNLIKQDKIPYDDGLYSHPFRKGTMPTHVKLHAPIVKAVEMWKINAPFFNQPDAPDFMMVSKPCTWKDASGKQVRGKEFFLELLWQDGTGTILHKKGNAIRISDMEGDGTDNPIGEFKTLDEYRMAAIYLLCMPEILEADRNSAFSRLENAMEDLSHFAPEFASWASASDIPDMAKESAFFMDAILCYAKDTADWEFADAGNVTVTVAEQVDLALYRNAPFSGATMVCSNPNVQFRYVVSNGATDRGAGAKMTIGEAKAKYAAFSAHRTWTMAETMMIPYFSDDTPVMEETIFMANRFFGTRDSVIPVCNGMWRGVTGYGKSTGVRQLACILNMPLLIITCHPGMEISEFKSNFVPATEHEGLEVDWTNVALPQEERVSAEVQQAINHVVQMEEAEREEFLRGTGFLMDAMMDADYAALRLFGKSVEKETDELLRIYTDTVVYFREKPLRAKIASLETDGAEKQPEKQDNKPAFKHVLSNYFKALINGYIIEIQEPSRIRDSGVLVGLNEYDHAGAILHLMNGGMARRHKDALVIKTDNVGYASCRQLDPSNIRRDGFVIDSFDLSEQLMKDRARRNTGCTDMALLNRCYAMWLKVKEYCDTNSITEGSVSPVEFERLLQAVMLDGEDSLEMNLDRCVISKASSSAEDQRDIRSALASVA